MSQHTYELKFTIGIDNPEEAGIVGAKVHDDFAKVTTPGETKEIKPELLTQVIGPDGATKEDVIKALVEERIEKACGMLQGIISVNLDSLTEV